jgi:hypothetical protein
MSRKPAPPELVNGIGLRQRIWDRIRGIPEGIPFSQADLLSGHDVYSKSSAREYLSGLKNAGYLVMAVPHTRHSLPRYVLVNDAGIEAPRVRRDGTPVTGGLREEQMWRTLRLLPGDTCARELAAHASTPEINVAEKTAVGYLRDLHRAGYLQITRPAKFGGRSGGGQRARYRLITNTGPRPPMVCRTKTVYDPNLGEIIWMARVTEEDAIYE